MKKNISVSAALLLVLLQQANLHAIDFAIVGGQDDGYTTAYSVLVAPDADTSPITGDFPSSMDNAHIYAVSINEYGYALVGGTHMGSVVPYAAYVQPSGVALPLTGPHLPPAFGEIFSVAINSSGNGIIGGYDFTDPYVALVSSSQVTQSLSGMSLPSGNGQISSVAINNSGYAVIGGIDNAFTTGYAALVDPSGVTGAPLMGALPTGASNIRTVAINEAGTAIIGGYQNFVATTEAYVGVVDPSGSVSALSGPHLPTGDGDIRSVAINDAGYAMIGGWDVSQMNMIPYIAAVSPSNVATSLSGDLPTGEGTIFSVAINNSGSGIVGGTDGGPMTPGAYAAVVSPAGVATRIFGEVPTGDGAIYSVAISESGVGIIGGSDQGYIHPYAALVAPSGAATAIKGAYLPTGNGEILSVSIAGLLDSVVQEIVPTAYGPGNSYANPLFDLSSRVFPAHYMIHHRDFWRKRALEEEEIFEEQVELLTDAAETIRHRPPCQEKADFCLWTSLFGDAASQKGEKELPAYDCWIGGALLALDYQPAENFTLGGGAAYTFNYVHQSRKLGHSKINQEYLTLYASWERKYFFLDLALWGGIYQMENIRHSFDLFTSRSNVDGWLLLPHLELSAPIVKNGWFVFDPFAMFDYANNWQGKVREKGASGFNIEFDSSYASILRSEIGLRFFEIFEYGWGHFIVQEKGSFINKTPFHASNANAVFVGSPASFGVEIFNSESQNLGAVQMNLEFIPNAIRRPYFSLNYQGEFSSKAMTNLVSLESGLYF